MISLRQSLFSDISGEHRAVMDFDPNQISRRIGAGDKTAETALVQHFSPRLMFMLRQRTNDEQLAEDLHQDTLRIVLERLRSPESIAEPEKLAGFVHKTALNVYIGYVRREGRRNTHAGGDLFDELPAVEPSQLDDLLREEKISAVRTVIDGMRVERDRDILYRFYVRAQEKPDICQALGISSENFDRVISRARKRFREAFTGSTKGTST